MMVTDDLDLCTARHSTTSKRLADRHSSQYSGKKKANADSKADEIHYTTSSSAVASCFALMRTGVSSLRLSRLFIALRASTILFVSAVVRGCELPLSIRLHIRSNPKSEMPRPA